MFRKISKDQASLCAFTSTDGRRCRMPRNSSEEEFCYNHQRKLTFQREAGEAAHHICEAFSPTEVPASAISISLSRLFFATAQGRISPRTANALANIANSMLRAVPLTNNEFSRAIGDRAWRNIIRQVHGYAPLDPIPDVPSPSTDVASPTTDDQEEDE
jgi:hypothetical protein